jgi:hypothetical protein
MGPVEERPAESAPSIRPEERADILRRASLLRQERQTREVEEAELLQEHRRRSETGRNPQYFSAPSAQAE